MKPSFDDAPKWANYIAQNPDGVWFWWRCKPQAGSAFEGWCASVISLITFRHKAAPYFQGERSDQWFDTLQARP